MSLNMRGQAAASFVGVQVALWVPGSAITSGCGESFSGCRASRSCPEAQAGAEDDAGHMGNGSGGSGQGGGGNGAPGGTSLGGVSTGAQSDAADGGAENTDGGGVPSQGDRGRGAAGAPEHLACSDDADCDDGLSCNGEETCVDGACQAGASLCENPDPAHCAVTCKERGASVGCGVKGKDDDADGHLSAACAAEPGDDCDDARGDVYPGATELCDGVDHDCNGKLGLDDGLAVSGSSEQIGDLSHAARASPSVAWSDESSAYGVVWVDSESADGAIQFIELNQAGQIVTAAMAAGGTEHSSGSPDIAWGADSFGIAWAGRYTNDETLGAIYLRRLDAAGTPLSLTQTVTYEGDTRWPRLARVADGPWVVQFSGCSFGCYVSASVVPPGEAAGSRIQGPQLDDELTGLAASASNLVATYENAGAPQAELRDPQYTLVNPIGITGLHALVGSTASTFAIVTQQASGKPKFALFDGNGKSKCGPVEIGDSTFVPSSVAGGDSGFLVVSSGHVRGQVISGSCTPGPIFEIDAGSASESRVAAGKRGYAVVWSDAITALPWRRLFGSRICN